MKEYVIKAITPIVTGDKDKKNEKLIVTGLIGSLRYQYWLLKAMEAWKECNSKPAYPPIRCEISDKTDKTKENLQKAGPVVQLFGDTGWKRIFRLELVSAAKSGEKRPLPAAARPAKDKAPYLWEITLRFRLDRETTLLDGLLDLDTEIEKLMAFVHYYGWLCSAPQNGFGLVEIVDPPDITVLNEIINKVNPVFSYCEIVLSQTQFDNLKNTLYSFYKTKKEDKALEVLPKDNSDQKEKKIKRKKRYENILKFINRDDTPIGYEIRRYLKHCFKEDPFFGKSGENNGHASYIHVTHPVKKGESYIIRLRFCARPDDNNIVPNPNTKTPEQWLVECKNEINEINEIVASPLPLLQSQQVQKSTVKGKSKITETGVVKKWFDDKGYGFITLINGQDIFVHKSGINGSGHKTLNKGDNVNFTVGIGKKGPCAVDVTVLSKSTGSSNLQVGKEKK